ncbi:MAG: hypothetical protein ACJ72A_18720 [Nocardioidaceae bacterium]
MTNAGEIWVSNNAGPLAVASAGVYHDSAGPRAHEVYGSPAGVVTNEGPTLN